MFDAHPLAGPWLKVDRAGEHLKALNRALRAFYEHGCRVTHRADAGGRFEIIRAELRNPDLEIGTNGGEFLYQIRSALDHLACALVAANGKPLTRRTGFPIFERRNDGRFLEQIGGMAEEPARIVEGLQPYQAAPEDDHYPLFALHQLSMKDRHAKLVGDASGLTMRVPKVDGVRLDWRDGGLEVSIPLGVAPDFEPQPSFEVVFGAEQGSATPTGYSPSILGDIYYFIRYQVFPLFRPFFPDSRYFNEPDPASAGPRT